MQIGTFAVHETYFPQINFHFFKSQRDKKHYWNEKFGEQNGPAVTGGGEEQDLGTVGSSRNFPIVELCSLVFSAPSVAALSVLLCLRYDH